MTSPQFDKVVSVVADPFLQARSAAESAFNAIGVRDVRLVGTLDALRAVLREKFVDLLLVNAEWPEGDVCEVLTDIRHARCGPNPYLGILVAAPDAETPAGWRPLRFGAGRIAVWCVQNTT